MKQLIPEDSVLLAALLNQRSQDCVRWTHLNQRNSMNYFPLTAEQQEWKERTTEIAERDIGPRAADYDRKAQFPQESLNALRDAGLWAMRVL